MWQSNNSQQNTSAISRNLLHNCLWGWSIRECAWWVGCTKHLIVLLSSLGVVSSYPSLRLYNSPTEPPMSEELHTGRILLQCPPGQELSNGNTRSDSAAQKSRLLFLNLSAPSIDYLEDNCLGKSRKCFVTDMWPHPTNSKTDVIRYGIVCRRRGDTSCKHWPTHTLLDVHDYIRVR